MIMRFTMVIMLASTVGLCGCMGSFRSRWNSERTHVDAEERCHWIGAYPYEAVYRDGRAFVLGVQNKDSCYGLPGNGFNVPRNFAKALGGLISIPCDACLDTVLLFPDLVGWACGWHKYPILDWRSCGP